MNIFDKKIVLDEAAMKNLLNCNTVEPSKLKNVDTGRLMTAEEIVEWFQNKVEHKQF